MKSKKNRHVCFSNLEYKIKVTIKSIKRNFKYKNQKYILYFKIYYVLNKLKYFSFQLSHKICAV